MSITVDNKNGKRIKFRTWFEHSLNVPTYKFQIELKRWNYKCRKMITHSTNINGRSQGHT